MKENKQKKNRHASTKTLPNFLLAHRRKEPALLFWAEEGSKVLEGSAACSCPTFGRSAVSWCVACFFLAHVLPEVTGDCISMSPKSRAESIGRIARRGLADKTAFGQSKMIQSYDT